MFRLLASAALLLQLGASSRAAEAQRPGLDSARELGHAKNAQASFERSRRALLPFGAAGGGRCDVRLGRFCWWYDETPPTLPPESETIGKRRAELLERLDAAAARFPGDEWLIGMRVHYRIDGNMLGAADSVAHGCRSTVWWCLALRGYAAHSLGDGPRADAAFTAAVDSMPEELACAWRSIAPLLASRDRDRFERLGCTERRAVEARYWLLSRPHLARDANEWKNEFHVRRVLVWLGERAATPHLLGWGDDAAELVLRYGWPTAWSRVETSSVGATEPGIVGHDPSPSFAFAPGEGILDSARVFGPDGWTLDAPRAEARYAPPRMKRVASVRAQVARFRRGDSTLVVAAFAASDDSLLAPLAILGASRADGITVRSTVDSVRAGHARLMMHGHPFIAGVEVEDSARATVARTRQGFAPTADSARISLSDILVHRGGEAPVTSLDSALARAVRGDTVTRTRAIGLFWETYGLAPEGEAVDVAVSVERVDRSWIRSARQRLGLTPVDTPVRIHWSDARPPVGEAAANAISLDLENLDPGRYRITLSLTPADGVPAVSMRELELLER